MNLLDLPLEIIDLILWFLCYDPDEFFIQRCALHTCRLLRERCQNHPDIWLDILVNGRSIEKGLDSRIWSAHRNVELYFVMDWPEVAFPFTKTLSLQALCARHVHLFRLNFASQTYFLRALSHNTAIEYLTINQCDGIKSIFGLLGQALRFNTTLKTLTVRAVNLHHQRQCNTHDLRKLTRYLSDNNTLQFLNVFWIATTTGTITNVLLDTLPRNSPLSSVFVRRDDFAWQSIHEGEVVKHTPFPEDVNLAQQSFPQIKIEII